MAKLMFIALCLLAAGYVGVADGSVADIISETMFNAMLPHRNDAICPAKGFYTYRDFINAAKSFPAFGGTGNVTVRKREVAAFLGQTSYEISGSSPDGPYTWGYCFKKELGNPPPIYCQPSKTWPCVPSKRYYGRGPIQLTWNFNYGPAGKALNFNGLADPDIVERNATIAFKTALWFWMTAAAPKPSCHNVITGIWKPSAADIQAGRLGGYGTITNIINGGECNHGPDRRVKARMEYYKRYCDMLKIPYGNNLDCYKEKPFGISLFSQDADLSKEASMVIKAQELLLEA